MQEQWAPIDFFKKYWVSNTGQVRKDNPEGTPMIVGNVTDGSLSVVLTLENRSRPYLLRRLVAEAFCERLAPHFDTVIHLDADKTNCHYTNLVWRPRWYAIKYTRQMHGPISQKWLVPVRNISTDEDFATVYEAAIRYGMLCDDINRHASEGTPSFPYRYFFMRI